LILVEKLSFKSKENTRLTDKAASKHEFISQKYVLQRHLQLLQLADGEEKYSEELFSKLDFNEELSGESPPPKTEDQELEEAVEFELEEPGEFEEKSSSEHEEAEENESAIDAQVEFMDDEESDMDALDESNSNPSPPQNNKPSPKSPENPTITVEYQEPPTEFVDDDSQGRERVPETFEESEATRQGRSRSPSPGSFLEQQDDIM
jgi:hypothetical protein